MSNQNNQQQIQIKAPDEVIKGVYANNMQVMHTKEEFAIDFMNILPPSGTLVSRVVVSPAHLKRMVRTLAGNLKKYEDQFGVIAESENPNEIGFKA